MVAAARTTIPPNLTNFTYNPTITLQVPAGTAMGNIPLVNPQLAINPATVSGQVTTTNSVGPTTADISLSALLPVQPAGSFLVTIPPLQNSTSNLTSDVGSYRLVLPASNPQVGTFNGSPQTAYTPPPSGQPTYQLEARVFTPMSFSNPGSPDCSPSSLSTPQPVSPGSETTNQNFPFIGCQ